MKIITRSNQATWAQAAAEEIAQQIRNQSASAVGLATGTTTVSLHEALVSQARQTALDFSGVSMFALDEYCGIPRSHPASCYSRLDTQLFGQVNIPKAQIHCPDVAAGSLTDECKRYEQSIQQQGGIDLQIVGIGLNGHIGFNEPGTPFESLTHISQIASETRSVQADTFGSLEQVPQQGITQGIKTIMQARKVMLLAWGSHKRDIISRALNGPVTPEVPASVLQLHPNLLVVLDEAAADGLYVD